ncbi:MAG: DUF6768 family protein [Paracoccaceae bacterium]
MDDLDKKIQDMLNAEEREVMESFEQHGLFGQFASVFQGGQAWFMMVVSVIGIIMASIGLYAAIKFATVADLTTMIRWGGVAWFGLFSISIIKVWSWMRMETNRTLREIKRLELQVAMLQAKS